MTAAEDVKDQAKETVREAGPWLEPLGRLGFAAKGAVYMLIGALALRVALGLGGETTDAQGALRRMLTAPFGALLLVATAVGLFGYALWRFVQAAMDTEWKGSDAKGLVQRIAYAVSGCIHLGLAFWAARLLTGDSGGGDAARSWTAQLMSRPAGAWLVGIVGAIVIGVGLYQFYHAFSAKFREELLLGRMGPAEEEWLTRLGRFGYAARGVVFGLVGLFLVVAARQAEPGAARGLGGALATLARQRSGSWLLGVVAAGLVAYGALMLAEARYRRMVIR